MYIHYNQTKKQNKLFTTVTITNKENMERVNIVHLIMKIFPPEPSGSSNMIVNRRCNGKPTTHVCV